MCVCVCACDACVCFLFFFGGGGGGYTKKCSTIPMYIILLQQKSKVTTVMHPLMFDPARVYIH